jgi:hypothetical protein
MFRCLNFASSKSANAFHKFLSSTTRNLSTSTSITPPKKYNRDIYTCNKPPLYHTLLQYYLQYRPYVLMVTADTIFLACTPIFSTFLTPAIGVLASTVIGFQIGHSTPKPTLVTAISLLNENEPSKIVLQLHNGETQVVFVNDIVMDHDPLFSELLPTLSYWRRVLLNKNDLSSRHELKFAILESNQSYYGGNQQQDHVNTAVTLNLLTDGLPKTAPIYIMRSWAPSGIESVRSQLDYYRSL